MMEVTKDIGDVCQGLNQKSKVGFELTDLGK